MSIEDWEYYYNELEGLLLEFERCYELKNYQTTKKQTKYFDDRSVAMLNNMRLTIFNNLEAKELFYSRHIDEDLYSRINIASVVRSHLKHVEDVIDSLE